MIDPCVVVTGRGLLLLILHTGYKKKTSVQLFRLRKEEPITIVTIKI